MVIAYVELAMCRCSSPLEMETRETRQIGVLSFRAALGWSVHWLTTGCPFFPRHLLVFIATFQNLVDSNDTSLSIDQHQFNMKAASFNPFSPHSALSSHA